MESKVIKTEVIEWIEEKLIEDLEIIKNEELTCTLCNDEVNIKNEFEENLQETFNEYSDNIVKDEYIEFVEVKIESGDSVLPNKYDFIQTTESSITPCLKEETHLEQENSCRSIFTNTARIEESDKAKLYLDYNSVKSFQCHTTADPLHLVECIPTPLTDEKPFECTYCNFRCSSKYSLTRHMQRHTGEKIEKPYACNMCNYRCAAKSILVIHIRTHTGEKPFVCNMCNYKGLSKSDLVKHSRSHTGIKPFPCNLCKYKASTKSHLVRHVRTHTGEKPYNCYVCNLAFADKSSLARHLKIHPDEKLLTHDILKNQV